MPSAEPTVMDMVLAELRGIRDSIHEMRDKMNSNLGDHANQLAAIAQWKESHEQWAHERVDVVDGHADRLVALERQQNEQNGAVRSLRWIGALLFAGASALEAWLHRGHP